MLKKIIFEIETITPMFLSGADQSRAELRAASIKGLLRFWWRALQAEPDLNKLLEKESKIFGSSDEKGGGAKFSIRVTQPDKSPITEYPNPGRHDPVGYHLYSVFMQRDRKRPYFPEGSRFRIMLTSRNENALKIASTSLWALVYLGGIGTRARRGAGNTIVTNLEDDGEVIKSTGLDFTSKGKNAEDVALWLKKNFDIAKRIINDNKTIFIPEYSNLSFSRFVISNRHFTNWKNALGSIGFKAFRDRNKSRIFDTPSFGFPVIHRTNNIIVTGKVKSELLSRRSSPIIFKLMRVNNHYYWIVIRMAGEFLPNGGVIKAGQQTQKPDYGIIDEFWAELKENGNEHILSMPDTLVELKNKLVESCNPQKIILFGSKSRGDFHMHSDTDIAIDTDEPFENDFIGAIDIVDLKRADENLRKKIMKEGVIIYERKA